MLERLVRDHRVVVCVGSGGVGKTTTAATIALWGALEGRRAVVLTIDPARRLANSLGIAELGDEPRMVDPKRTAVCPVTTAEEMPVNETIEMYEQLRERLHMPLGVLFVNRVHAAPVASADVPAVPAGATPLVDDVLRCAREEAGWAAINRRYLERLRDAVPMPTVVLPFLFAEEFGIDEVRALLAKATPHLGAFTVGDFA